MGLDWPHTPETKDYRTGPNMEFTGQEEERKVEEFLEVRHYCRHRGIGAQL